MDIIKLHDDCINEIFKHLRICDVGHFILTCSHFYNKYKQHNRISNKKNKICTFRTYDAIFKYYASRLKDCKILNNYFCKICINDDFICCLLQIIEYNNLSNKFIKHIIEYTITTVREKIFWDSCTEYIISIRLLTDDYFHFQVYRHYRRWDDKYPPLMFVCGGILPHTVTCILD